jgi:hypothetical protein
MATANRARVLTNEVFGAHHSLALVALIGKPRRKTSRRPEEFAHVFMQARGDLLFALNSSRKFMPMDKL